MMRAFLLINVCLLAFCCQVKKNTNAECVCDTVKLKSQLRPIVSTPAAEVANFYKENEAENRRRWFAEIERIDSTQFTRLWDDYHDNNFHTSHADFKSFYENSDNTELAFQFGPEGPLWTYYTFILKKKKGCYVFTRTNFAHARFRYKAYSFVGRQTVDDLFDYINTLKRIEMDEPNYMAASFVDNRNDEVFDVEIERFSMEQNDGGRRLPPDSAIIVFLKFLDNEIRWTETYPLEPEALNPEELRSKTYARFSVSGSYKMENEEGSFTGGMTIEKKEGYIYYSWDITSSSEKLLAAKSSIIDFKYIPKKGDHFEFVKNYVLREIREYRIKDKEVVFAVTVSSSEANDTGKH
ncbi:hypothetical protein [Chryseolinea soli]|uniref:Uncharacterized protein n=1 Tax=Chryseolinea soli TaxID=2321403 RepID=A0A385SZJ5_9BACT|nr:hypothetical protein [Chryseolinea soli]AYB34188.1 hypothetical protein D4L85_28005 [Chryseolinea soli]